MYILDCFNITFLLAGFCISTNDNNVRSGKSEYLAYSKPFNESNAHVSLEYLVLCAYSVTEINLDVYVVNDEFLVITNLTSRTHHEICKGVWKQVSLEFYMEEGYMVSI